MPRKKSLKTLHKEAWTIFSKWIRNRDGNICYTCGKPGTESGHFRHYNSMDFKEKNIHCQCVSCNHYKSGNLGIYANNLIKQYGTDILDELILESHQVHKFRREELEEIKEKYEKI